MERSGFYDRIYGKLSHFRYEGERNAMVGMFPVSYVEIINDAPEFLRSTKNDQIVKEGKGKVKYSFHAQTQMELSLTKGEIVTLTRKVDQNWLEGRIGNRRGIFPASYISVISPPPEGISVFCCFLFVSAQLDITEHACGNSRNLSSILSYDET